MLWCIPTMCVCAFLVCSVCTSFRLGEGAKLEKPPMLISRCLLHAAERPPPPAPTSECLLQQLFLVIISTELFNTLSSPHSLYLPLYSLSGALKGSSNDIMFIAATFHSDFFFWLLSRQHFRYECVSVQSKTSILQRFEPAAASMKDAETWTLPRVDWVIFFQVARVSQTIATNTRRHDVPDT